MKPVSGLFASALILGIVYLTLSSLYSTVDHWSRWIKNIGSSLSIGEPSSIDQVSTIYNKTAPNTQDLCPGYSLTAITNNDSQRFSAVLQLAGESCNAYGMDVETLKLTVEYQDSDRLSVSISPLHLSTLNESYYILPDDVVPRAKIQVGSDKESSGFLFEYSDSPSFWFKVTRKSSGDVLFSTEGSKIVYENQFIEFKTLLPSKHNLYGLGETLGSFKIKPGSVRTMFNADVPDIVDANNYGTHPFYIEQRFIDGSMISHGVYLRNAHGHEILVGDESLTWRTLGGTIDLYFFSGPSAKSVIQQYQAVVGLPAFQQYWTLGFHQCRWGYEKVSDLAAVIEEHRKQNIPLETVWSDLDYMDSKRDFTTEPVNYPPEKFGEFLNDLHSNNQHYVPIVDAAIYAAPENVSYSTWTSGVESDVFIHNPDGSIFIGRVWPGDTAFPDWFAENTTDWWIKEFYDFQNLVAYDGIWLDMNEVSNFCTGDCYNTETVLPYPYSNGAYNNGTVATNPDINARNLNFPPYVMNNYLHPNQLSAKTLSPNAIHQNGVAEYDVHNLWGYLEEKNTYLALSTRVFPGKRPFLISRSTFAGSGNYTGHWGGDNYAEWDYMKWSITQGLSFSMFGIPMFGTDTCGFQKDSNEELCNRWAQLNAFFSFYRNHNDISGTSQEFTVWPSVAQAARDAMTIRYSLLPYMYTLLYKTHITGETFLRALTWEFPEDESLVDIDTQFMVGPSILVIPVLEQGATQVTGVFPEGNDQVWYDWYSKTAVHHFNGQNPVVIDAPLGHIPVYIRGGSILPLQTPGYTTTESRQGDWQLVIALDKNGQASGELYQDDGESIHPSQVKYSTFRVSKNKLKIDSEGSFEVLQPLTKITILGVEHSPKSNVQVFGHEVDNVVYDSKSKTLEVALDQRFVQTSVSWLDQSDLLSW